VFKAKIEAADELEAKSAIQSLGRRILKIKEDRNRPGLEALFPSFFTAGNADIILLSRQLAAMLSSGGSLMRALEMAQGQSKNRVMRRTIGDMIETLSAGGSLTEAMKKHPKIFDKLFLSVVEVGEFTGGLVPSLEQIADMLAADADAKARAIKTMMYPMVIMGMSFMTLGVLMVVAVPPLLKVFDSMGADVPWMTLAAVAAVDFIFANWLKVFTGIAVFFISVNVLRRIPVAARQVDAISAKLPLYGPLTLAGDLARFSKTMAMMLGAGVPLVDSLRLGIEGCKNVRVREAFLMGEQSLLSGHGLTAELRNHKVLPSMFVELVMMGEEGNHLAKMMGDAAVTYQKEKEERLGAILGALEPASTVLVGAIVAFIAFSMFVPIYSGLDALA
ncbi:MAG: type II secretion system F family protein, partial [Dehalococcoidia bacterium]